MQSPPSLGFQQQVYARILPTSVIAARALGTWNGSLMQIRTGGTQNTTKSARADGATGA